MVDSQLHVIEVCSVVVVCVGMKESGYGLVQLCDLYLFVPRCIVPAAVTQFEEVKKKYIEEYQNVSGQSLLTAVLLLLTHALPATTTITAESLLFVIVNRVFGGGFFLIEYKATSVSGLMAIVFCCAVPLFTFSQKCFQLTVYTST